jgi:hypothetical protein
MGRHAPQRALDRRLVEVIADQTSSVRRGAAPHCRAHRSSVRMLAPA